MDMRCRITSGGGDPRESATENKPPSALPGACGKGETVRQERTALTATPAARQTPPGAKPHRDGVERLPRKRQRFQDRCLDPAVRVGCLKRRATGAPEEWPSRVSSQLAPHRTRLTGRLRCDGEARRGNAPGLRQFWASWDCGRPACQLLQSAGFRRAGGTPAVRGIPLHDHVEHRRRRRHAGPPLPRRLVSQDAQFAARGRRLDG
jgi:hypothetical protein